MLLGFVFLFFARTRSIDPRGSDKSDKAALAKIISEDAFIIVEVVVDGWAGRTT
jgi:hypothetical protein